MDYEQELEIFSSNINIAARAYYYYIEINNQVDQDGLYHQSLEGGHFIYSKKYQAMQANARFWNDYKYFTVQSLFICLGRIFTKDNCKNNKSHCLDRLLKKIRNTDVFKKEKLKERKKNLLENLDEYMRNVHELSENDFTEIENFVLEAKNEWNKIKNVRHKIFAHQDLLNEDKKSEILKMADNLAIEKIINCLLTLEHILCEAFNNGKKPDYSYCNTRLQNSVRNDVEKLLERLS